MYRRQFLLSTAVGFTCGALLVQVARPASGKSRGKFPKPAFIPDYDRNPFVRPIGAAFEPHENRSTPPPVSGSGIEDLQ
jgi:hypothetical protein